MPRTVSTPNMLPKTTMNNKFEKRLAAYVAAAGAAGVALLAAPLQAGAEVVYTPSHTRIDPNSTYQIDLNHDGIDDIGLQMLPIYHSSFLLALADVTGNQVVGASISAAVLPLGSPIGPRRKFASKSTYGGAFMAIGGAYGTLTWFRGPWAHAIKEYLGVKFLINGEVHYGWVRLSVNNFAQTGEVLLFGYAYETVANKPIPAGKEYGSDERAAASPAQLTEPVSPMATLGMLACGAGGLDLWRREEEPARQPMQG